MSGAFVGPDGGLVGPAGADVGPDPGADVPTAVLTLTGGIDFEQFADPPTATLTLSAAAPAWDTPIPNAALTLSATGPGYSIDVPTATITLTSAAPTVLSGTLVDVPNAMLRLSSFLYVTDSGITAVGGPVQLFLDGFEIGGDRVEWDISGEEVLGDVGTAHLGIIDLDPLNSDFEPTAHMDVKVVIRDSGWVLFHGETLEPGCDLEENTNLRRWKIECRDFNGQLAERLVGAPDGYFFWRPNVETPYRAIDPSAISFATDKLTVQYWVRHYLALRMGSIDVNTHVHEYIDNGVLGAPENILWLYDAMMNLQSALEMLASLGEVNIQGWLWPDDKYNWKAIPTWQSLVAGGSTGDLVASPVVLGVGGAPLLALGWKKDGRDMAEQLYLNGATPYLQDPDTGAIVSGGSGWWPDRYADPLKRQTYHSAPGVWTEARKNRVGDSAYRRGQEETLRLTAVTEGVDGFRTGMYQQINEPRLPPSMQDGSGVGTFVIQRVGWSVYGGSRDTTRRYELGLGDGPPGRINEYATRQHAEAIPALPTGVAAKPPSFQLAVDIDVRPVRHGDRRTFTARPQNDLNSFYKLQGMTINFRLNAYDATTKELIDPGDTDAALDASSVSADIDGVGRGAFTADSTRDDVEYDVQAWVVITPAS